MKKLLRNPLGLILLVVGIILLFWGYNASQSLESQVSNVVSGSPSDESMYLYVGGAICVILGLTQVIRALR